MSAQSTFAYKARDSQGQMISGSLVASSSKEVGEKLRAEGKYVVSVEDHAMNAGTPLDPEQIRRDESAKRIRREDVIGFCQQLSVMLETGVPLTEALDAFCRQTPRPEFRNVLNTLREDICSGEPFSTAMAKWPSVFPNMMVSLMKASEASGTMAMMLGRVGEYLAKERRTARQVKGALSYPMFMILAGLTMTVFLMAFVLPKFAEIYSNRSANLPAPTQLLMAVSDFITTQYIYYLPAGVVIIVITYIWSQTSAGRRHIDWLKLSTPIIGPMFQQLYLTRAARTMSTLLAAGVNLIDIIGICRGVTQNAYYEDLWDDMETDVRDGQQISQTCFESSIIPANVASMISAGEKSGRLSDVMGRIAEFSEEELDTAVKQATSFIEPIMIIAMGLMVGLVAMALLLPIFSMGTVVTQ